MHTVISRICNIDLLEENWIQLTLPTHLGDIGIKYREDIALPAFISKSAMHQLTSQITCRSHSDDSTLLTSALTTFSALHPEDAQNFFTTSPL